jgi:hypothetical protein
MHPKWRTAAGFPLGLSPYILVTVYVLEIRDIRPVVFTVDLFSFAI